MAQIGSEDKPFMLHPKGAVSKESRFRKGFNKIKYDQNYEKIFGNTPNVTNRRPRPKQVISTSQVERSRRSNN